jgi:DNA-binding FadR family transcriptional regulator
MARNLTTEAASSGSLREGCRRHEDLLEALQSREPERIRRAMRAHGERRFLDGVKEVP